MSNLHSFMEMDPGSRCEVSDSMQSHSAAAISQQLGNLCENAHLPRAGAYAFHHEVSNDFGLKMGYEFSANLLGHDASQNSTLHKHYSRGSEYVPVVAIRLGELEMLNSEVAKATEKQHCFVTAAVKCLVACQILHNSEKQEGEQKTSLGGTRLKLNREEREEIMHDEMLVEHAKEVADAWEKIYSIHDERAHTYKTRMTCDKRRVKCIVADIPLCPGITIEQQIEMAKAFLATLKEYQDIKKMKMRKFEHEKN
ncbi:uncharacterized protein LAESUDRAFT_716745 [Laetiporus sulphureus 93-53]|uniref:Uncharacterized protein n=1 Tax=Laetiporus sulphureus 93-53 TaxID=1314785 RepID=A0A165CGF3_9APHY|nr:uncharacterized protein LAESUDRAFT_716745 [Laetiporus sulphureus 93-53]KZT02763.1 hypothetical protein LAESUDRAFT_716745 [Laetiporus sulphureus 93-53]